MRLSSMDRVSGSLNSFNVDFSSLPRFQEVRGVEVKYIGFPHVQTNVNTGTNTFVLRRQLSIQPLTFADTIFTVPVGQYSAPELAALLTTTVNTQEPTWNFTCELIDETTNPRFVFTSTERIIYVSSRDVPASTLSDLLGIIDSSPESGGTLAFTPEFSPGMNGLHCAWLHCKAIALARCGQAQNNPERKQAISLAIVSQVPVNVGWRQYVNYEPKTDNIITFSSPVNLCSMEFRLREQWHRGRLVDLCYPGVSVCIEVDTK